MAVQFICVAIYVGALVYTLLIDQEVVRLGASQFHIWIDWPYFALFGSLLTLFFCSIIFGVKMFVNAKSLLLLQLTIYGFHQFEEHAYDLFGRRNYFIHHVNHEVIGLPFHMKCDEYILTQRHVYIINIIYIWIMIPLCIFITTIYSFRNACVVTIGTIAINGLGHILNGIVFWRYNPGLLTSVFLFMPYCYYTLNKMVKKGYMLSTDYGLALLFGVLMHLPLILTMFAVSEGLLTENEILVIYFIVLFVINLTYFVSFSQKGVKNIKKNT